jgi:hypothetical protein
MWLDSPRTSGRSDDRIQSPLYLGESLTISPSRGGSKGAAIPASGGIHDLRSAIVRERDNEASDRIRKAALSERKCYQSLGQPALVMRNIPTGTSRSSNAPAFLPAMSNSTSSTSSVTKVSGCPSVSRRRRNPQPPSVGSIRQRRRPFGTSAAARLWG